MRPRFSAKVLCLLLLGAGLGVGREGENESSQAFRTTSVADCTFERDPGAYLYRVRRHLEQLAADTENVSAGRVKYSSARKPRQDSGFTSDIPHRNYIDDYIFGKMEQAGVPHAPLADDAEFFRRINLDLTGRIPSADAVRAFLGSDVSTKRNDVIRDLAGSAECTDKLTMYYGDLMKAAVTDTVSAVQNIYVEGRNAFYMAIKRGVETQMPYDAFVKRFIAGEGSSWDKGELNWLLKGTQAMGPVQDHYDMMLSRAATQFLGLSSFDCLLCHDGRGHLDVLNAWGASTQRIQAWEMAAFFSRTRFPRSPTQLEGGQLYYWTVADAPNGEYQLNTNSGNRTPRTPFGNTNLIRPRYIFSTTQATGSTYREMFANNLIADRQFARATANYMWKYMMGMGIVEPADQFDLSRLDPNNVPSGWNLQPSHPELLEALTNDFIGGGYNVRRLLMTIAESSAYQLSSRFPGEWQPEYTSYFARKFARRLWAEEVHDAIVMAAGVPTAYGLGQLPTVQWAMQLPETSPEPRSNGAVNTFLNLFLRGNRDQNARSGEATILQALNMMNNTFVTTRLRNATAGSTVNRLLANRDYSDSRVVEELFLTALSRFPTAEELSVGTETLKANRIQGAENLMWVLLNKIDFLYNY
jgi:hypothetical protein